MPAERAGTMAGGEGRGLVEKEQLGVSAGLRQRQAPAASKLRAGRRSTACRHNAAECARAASWRQPRIPKTSPRAGSATSSPSGVIRFCNGISASTWPRARLGLRRSAPSAARRCPPRSSRPEGAVRRPPPWPARVRRRPAAVRAGRRLNRRRADDAGHDVARRAPDRNRVCVERATAVARERHRDGGRGPHVAARPAGRSASPRRWSRPPARRREVRVALVELGHLRERCHDHHGCGT